MFLRFILNIYFKFRLGAPLFFAYGADYINDFIQLMFIGHIGDTEIAAASLASSYCKVTGLTVIMGLLSAVDTLVSQSYGAKKYNQIADTCYNAIFIIIATALFLLPIWMVWNSIQYLKFKSNNSLILGIKTNIIITWTTRRCC